MKKVGILGGTFDPIHLGHINLAEAALEQFDLDSVAFMPTGVSPHKGKIHTTTLQQRLDMVTLAINSNDNFYISREEIDSDDEICYTYKTLQRLREKEADTEFYFILGGDSLRDFHGWRHPELISQYAVILAAVRDDMENQLFYDTIDALNKRFNADIRPLITRKTDVSSHEIRDLVKRGESIEGYVPDEVCDYISQNELYK
ncbi:MAG: nicotinate-nucleotide adenylyltransferase [Lachnospiraceae bacterium]|nr:nicotinate-nucleotide adenylyltransferase [Lachnospiraceae bacterium]